MLLSELGLSIKEVSEACDIPYRTLQNYLRGEREPSAKALAAIGTHLGVSLDWLLTGDGPMKKGAAQNTGKVAEEVTAYMSTRERALLDLFKELSDEDQREICRDAAEKKRMYDIEKQLKEVQAKLDAINKAG